MTRRIVIAAAIAAAVLVQITGCGTNPEEDYLRALDQSAPALYAAHSSRDLAARGREACNALATDALPTLFDGRVADGSSGATEWTRILDAAVDTLCTEHRNQLDEWMNGHK
ncbi:hypothetical protein [Microbacterium sp. zg-YB36]|uniref:hypothetical protein n=1 Tax=Microbacterium sp. zg-YB36 TaxID=2969407 RepID=UPI00214BADA7|nr:hypothetical protein [Microbacterium sp. zg-YB36]MDL5351543.1 hypothetical protein [Microbacterium sp. zg-YB36]